MKLKRGDGDTKESIKALLQVLRRIRWSEHLTPAERLVVDKAVFAVRRVPRMLGRGRVSLVALGIEDTRLTVTAHAGGVYVGFGRSRGGQWASLYELSVRPDGEAEESGNFRDLVALNQKYLGNWVKVFSVEYTE